MTSDSDVEGRAAKVHGTAGHEPARDGNRLIARGPSATTLCGFGQETRLERRHQTSFGEVRGSTAAPRDTTISQVVLVGSRV